MNKNKIQDEIITNIFDQGLDTLIEEYKKLLKPEFIYSSQEKHEWRLEWDGLFDKDTTAFKLFHIEKNKYLSNKNSILNWSETYKHCWQINNDNPKQEEFMYFENYIKNKSIEDLNKIKSHPNFSKINELIQKNNEDSSITEINLKKEYIKLLDTKRKNDIKKISSGCYLFSPNIKGYGRYFTYDDNLKLKWDNQEDNTIKIKKWDEDNKSIESGDIVYIESNNRQYLKNRASYDKNLEWTKNKTSRNKWEISWNDKLFLNLDDYEDYISNSTKNTSKEIKKTYYPILNNKVTITIGNKIDKISNKHEWNGIYNAIQFASDNGYIGCLDYAWIRKNENGYADYYDDNYLSYKKISEKNKLTYGYYILHTNTNITKLYLEYNKIKYELDHYKYNIIQNRNKKNIVEARKQKINDLKKELNQTKKLVAKETAEIALLNAQLRHLEIVNRTKRNIARQTEENARRAEYRRKKRLEYEEKKRLALKRQKEARDAINKIFRRFKRFGGGSVNIDNILNKEKAPTRWLRRQEDYIITLMDNYDQCSNNISNPINIYLKSTSNNKYLQSNSEKKMIFSEYKKTYLTGWYLFLPNEEFLWNTLYYKTANKKTVIYNTLEEIDSTQTFVIMNNTYNDRLVRTYKNPSDGYNYNTLVSVQPYTIDQSGKKSFDRMTITKSWKIINKVDRKDEDNIFEDYPNITYFYGDIVSAEDGDSISSGLNMNNLNKKEGVVNSSVDTDGTNRMRIIYDSSTDKYLFQNISDNSFLALSNGYMTNGIDPIQWSNKDITKFYIYGANGSPSEGGANAYRMGIFKSIEGIEEKMKASWGEPISDFYAYTSYVEGTTRFYVSESYKGMYRIKISKSPNCCGWKDKFSFYAYETQVKGSVPFFVSDNTTGQHHRFIIEPDKEQIKFIDSCRETAIKKNLTWGNISKYDSVQTGCVKYKPTNTIYYNDISDKGQTNGQYSEIALDETSKNNNWNSVFTFYVFPGINSNSIMSDADSKSSTGELSSKLENINYLFNIELIKNGNRENAESKFANIKLLDEVQNNNKQVELINEINKLKQRTHQNSRTRNTIIKNQEIVKKDISRNTQQIVKHQQRLNTLNRRRF